MPAHRSRSNSTSSTSSNPHKPRLFQCTGYGDCRMVFTRSEHLARHARKHTGEKPFQCIMPECNKMFSRFDNMMQHTQTHRSHQQPPLPLRRRRRSSTSSSSTAESVATLSDSDPMTKEQQPPPRRLSIADLCNPEEDKKHPELTSDELEALQAFGRLQRVTTPDFFESLRDLISSDRQCACL